MPGIFSFIKHPMLNLLEVSGKLIPGIEKSVALYYSAENQELMCQGLKKPHENDLIETYSIADQNYAQKLRTKKHHWIWMAAENLPFELSENKKVQLNIFDELENLVLCLGYLNPIDGKNDLLFLYLNSNLGSFGISNSNKPLATEHKSIIGAMAYNSFSIYINQQQKDSETLRAINQKIGAIQQENNQLKSELEHLKNSYRHSILEMCHQHLEKLSRQLSVNFELSNDAMIKLEAFRGNADVLMESLTQSAVLAVNMHFGNSNQTIVLKAWDIQIEAPNPVTENNKIDGLHERYYKTYGLLEKLETAARVVINNHQKLTSANVGNAFPSPITAPAISDALKNHQKKVVRLMREYPDHWQTIRNEFRPIRNILERGQTG